MKKIEILAPAGSLEGLYAAFKMGADAVYVGTSRFGARAFADNPPVEELEKALTYAHLRDKKIYLTVNTLLTDRELEEELYSMIRPLYEAGLDACIVQDMGVLTFLHDNFPDMDLHASTQMTLFSGEEANLLKPYGVTRYVPARELTIEEIREARRQTDMEIEVFVHGALCYCYSGQCLMSSVIGGRSGNRGMCAQPCRLPYRTEYGDGYFLSPRDTCTLLHIPELVDAGIDSFKIEGRMKKKEYSAYLSYLYRKYVDIYETEGKAAFEQLKKNPDSELWQDYRRSQDLYNRGGFSDSFLFEKDKARMVYTKKNGHYGTFVGEVTGAGRGKAVFIAREDIHYQDILEFREEDGRQAYEYTVKNEGKTGEKVTANVLRGSHIYPGQKVFRTRNAALLEEINERIDSCQDKYFLRGVFRGEIGKPACFVIAGNGVSVSVEGAVVQPASSHPVTEEDIEKRLNRLGGTDYALESLEIVIGQDCFIPLGGLKELRRQAIEQWERQAVKRRTTVMNRTAEGKLAAKEHKSGEKKPLHIISVASLSQLRAAVLQAEHNPVFHLKLEDIRPEEWEEAAALLTGRRAAISFPRILRGAGKKKFEKEWEVRGEPLRKLPMEMVIVNSFAMYLYARKIFPEAQWLADENLYMENHRAEEFYASLCIQPSPVREYGRTPVMVTEGCVAKTLGRCQNGEQRIRMTTPKGDEFIVVNHCKYCYNTVYAGKPVHNRGDSRQKRLDFTLEDGDEVRKVIKEWNF